MGAPHVEICSPTMNLTNTCWMIRILTTTLKQVRRPSFSHGLGGTAVSTCMLLPRPFLGGTTLFHLHKYRTILTVESTVACYSVQQEPACRVSKDSDGSQAAVGYLTRATLEVMGVETLAMLSQDACDTDGFYGTDVCSEGYPLVVTLVVLVVLRMTGMTSCTRASR